MNTTNRTSVPLAIALIGIACGFRLLRVVALPDLPNFGPLMAIALCGALVLPGSLAMLVPLVALVVSDLALNLYFHAPLLSWADLVREGCYGFAVASGLVLRRVNAGPLAILGSVAANSLIFYAVTNSASWLTNPAYAKTAAGWLQALTVGVPGYAQTWTFFGRSLASDLLFAGVFLLAIYATSRQRQSSPAEARA